METKRRGLTTDDLLRLQEENPRKRRRYSRDSDDNNSPSPGSGPNAEVDESSQDDSSSSEDEGTVQASVGESEDSIKSSIFAFKSRHTVDSEPSAKTSKSSSSAAPPTFASLGITQTLVSALKKMSIQVPTEIQAACIPPLFAGRDCIGNAKTGSGKTIAFALPILQKLSVDPYGIFALVLTPTRELAFQISEQFAVLGAPLNTRTAVVVGGMDMISQALELENRPHVVVATPGRIVDHLRSSKGEWDLSRIKFLVLDEADRLLTPTFAPELSYLFDVLPKERQTCLFTATLTPSIESITNAQPRPGKLKPFIHKIAASTETVGTLKQHYILTPSHVRESYLFYLLCNPPESITHLRRTPPSAALPPHHKSKSRPKRTRKGPITDEDEIIQPPPTIIFCARPRTAAYLTILLQTLNIRSTPLHSRLTQRERLNSLSLFRSSVIPVLVSTDVGARGLDIEDVALVVNWDMPSEPEEYTHRVGRTARRGKGGIAVSFVTEIDEERVLRIEERINTQLTEITLAEEKVLQKLNAVSTAKRMANLELHNSNFGKREEVHQIKRAKRKMDLALAAVA